MITTSFAPEYFPSIPPSVEYLAKDVPVPIPKSDNSRLAVLLPIGHCYYCIVTDVGLNKNTGEYVKRLIAGEPKWFVQPCTNTGKGLSITVQDTST